ncbi:MAG TPA: ferritin family protein [Usitatibacter sp.]|nr:ferritin family protein [Usitatibacter sp.]
MPEPLQTLESFYACALAIEREAAERYREFETFFAERGEAVLAAICGMLARMEAEHYAELTRASEGLALPSIDPAALGPDTEPAHESGPRKDFYRIADAEQLLEIALAGEIRAQRFFAWAAQNAADAAIRELAAGMVQEESRHIAWVTRAITLRNPLRA